MRAAFKVSTKAVFSWAALLLSGITFAHEGHNSSVPWQACEHKSLGEFCEYQNSKQDIYRGSCRKVVDDLICVRNKPIIKGCDSEECNTSSHLHPKNIASRKHDEG